jgi:hypothetical protein
LRASGTATLGSSDGSLRVRALVTLFAPGM